jgi:RHS repeat-associated protein
VAGYGFNSSADAVYDDEDRLTEWNRDDTNRDLEWDLSLVGDWDQFTVEGTGVSRTHGAAHELTAVGASSLSLDVKGNITQDTSKTNTHNYTWDFDNQLALADVDGTGGDEIEYTYDALGRRVSKKFPQGEDTCTILFVHSGQQILAEYKWEAATREEDSIKQQQQERTVAIGVVTTNASATVTLLRKYQYASYVDDRCVMVDLTALGAVAAGTEELFWQHANHLYSVAALTDANANLVERYTYDAYGNLTILDPAGTTVRTVSSYGNPYTFTGRRLDDETGLYYYRARYYDAELGRFVSRDPVTYAAGDLNLYRYVGNKPTSRLDPMGLRETTANRRNLPIFDVGVFIYGTDKKVGAGTVVDNLHTRYNGAKIAIDSINSIDLQNNVDNARITATKFICAEVCRYVEVDCANPGNYSRRRRIMVDIFGWSRGALVAGSVARRLMNDCRCTHKCQRSTTYVIPGFCYARPRIVWNWEEEVTVRVPVEIRFVGLVDPVHTGVLGAQSRLPRNGVYNSAAAYSDAEGTVESTVFRTVFYDNVQDSEHFDFTHSQIGRDPTVEEWMATQARTAGAPIR